MRWFGPDWKAPICKIARPAAMPLDVPCAHGCGHEILPGESGLLIPFFGPTAGRQTDGKVFAPSAPQLLVAMVDGEPHLAYHLVCFFDEIGVRGKTHV